MANARIRDGVQRPSFDGTELIELDDPAIPIGAPSFPNTTSALLKDWINEDQTNIIYFRSNGNNSNNGEAKEKSVLTMPQAVTRAEALTPGASNRVVLKSDDDGIYNQNVDLSKYLDIHAESITYGGKLQLDIGSSPTGHRIVFGATAGDFSFSSIASGSATTYMRINGKCSSNPAAVNNVFVNYKRLILDVGEIDLGAHSWAFAGQENSETHVTCRGNFNGNITAEDGTGGNITKMTFLISGEFNGNIDVDPNTTLINVICWKRTGGIDNVLNVGLGTVNVKELSQMYSYFDKVDNDISYYLNTPADATLTTSGVGDLQTAIDNLNAGEILEVKVNATYNPISLPNDKGFAVRVAQGYDVRISGQNCITIQSNCMYIFMSGFIIDSPTTADVNGLGSGICLDHEAICNNITFHNITIRNAAGSGVLLSYHQSTGGDNYATASTYPDEFSARIAFVGCHFHKATNDPTEGASLALRGIEQAYIKDCYFDPQQQGRGIQLQNCIDAYVIENQINKAGGGGNGEGIKTDKLGSPTYTNSLYCYKNRVKGCIEGIDIDDGSSSICIDNIVSHCSAEGFSLDDSSQGIFIGNISFNNDMGFRFEASSLGNLKYNFAYNNTTSNYQMDNGYTPDDSNSTSIPDSMIGADQIPYDNSSSSLNSTLVNDALDELASEYENTILVDNIHGSDSNDGLTSATQKQTIQAAYNAAKTTFGTPSSTNRTQVLALGANEFTTSGRTLTMDTDWVSVHVPYSIISTTGPAQQAVYITSDNNEIHVKDVTGNGTATTFAKITAAGVTKVYAENIINYGSGRSVGISDGIIGGEIGYTRDILTGLGESPELFIHRLDGDLTLNAGSNGTLLIGRILSGTLTTTGTTTNVLRLDRIYNYRIDAGAANYNPSALTNDYVITADNSAASRNIIISTEDIQTGSTLQPRFFIISDEYGNAATNNLVVSGESGTIDGVGSISITVDYGWIMVYSDGTNLHTVGRIFNTLPLLTITTGLTAASAQIKATAFTTKLNSFTVGDADRGSLVSLNNVAAQNVTFPDGSLAVGSQGEFVNINSGAWTFLAAGASSVISTFGTTTINQNDHIFWRKIDSTTYLITGDALSNLQWGYLHNMDQAIATTDSVTFSDIIISNNSQFGGVIRNKRTATSVDYNPSALTTDYLIAVTDTSVARAVTISTEDVQSGSTSSPRIMIVKDESGNAGTNNITVALESGNIDGAANFVINGNYNSVTIYLDGTNGWVI